MYNHWGSISCSWRHLSRIIACCPFNFSKKKFEMKNVTFFIWDKYCHLMIEPHWISRIALSAKRKSKFSSYNCWSENRVDKKAFCEEIIMLFNSVGRFTEMQSDQQKCKYSFRPLLSTHFKFCQSAPASKWHKLGWSG